MQATGVADGSAVTVFGWALLEHLAAALLGQAAQFLAIHVAIAVAVGVGEVAQQPAVGLGLPPIDAAITIAIRLAEEAFAALPAAGLGRRQIPGGEITPPLTVQPLEVAFQVGVPLHLLALQPLIAVAVQPFKQLLQALLVALLLRRGLGQGAFSSG